jgi:oligopeptide transport system substrate-binding protein
MSGWSSRFRFHRDSAWVLCVLWVLCVPWSGCAKRETAAKPEPTLRISQRNEPGTLDPQLATLPDEYFTARALFEGLTTPNPEGGDPLPGVAERWSCSPDGLRWTFHLRANAKWSNGDPVTAQDFIWSFRRMLTPSLGAAKAPLFFFVRQARAYVRGEVTDFSAVGFAAPDARTLVVTLDQPTPFLPALAATGAWLPVHPATVERHGIGRGSRWSEPGNLVGNGPYSLAGWTRAQRIELRRNEHYWDRDAVRVPVVQLVMFDNNDAEERAFRAGQIDITMTVPAARLEHYRQNEPAVLRRQPLFETRYLSLNTQRPPLGDARVRQALSLALDRRALTERVLKGGQEPTQTVIPPGLGGYPRTPIDPLPPEIRVVEARRLLTAAGYPDGQGFPRLEFSTWTNTPVLETVQQMWKQTLGIETAIALREGRAHMAALAAGDYDLALMPFIPDFDNPQDVLAELLSNSPTNYGRWSNPDYDRLVTSAARLAAPPPGNTQYGAAEQLLIREMPVIPMYFSTQHYLVAPRVKGWRSDPLWTRYYKHVTVDED